MRKRPHRRHQQQQQQRLQSTPASHPTTTERSCFVVRLFSWTVFHSYIVSLFYVLLLAGIAEVTLYSGLFHYPGSLAWYISSFDGVHAGFSHGKLQAERDYFQIDVQDAVYDLNASILWNPLLGARRMEFQIPSQNRKCRPLLFKDLLFSISFSVCHGDTVVVKRNCRDDASRVSDTECLKSSLPLSLLTNTDFIEEHSILGASKPEELVQEVGHLEDGSKPHGVICVESLVPAIDLQGSKSGVGVEDYMQVVPVEKSLFDLNDHEKILEEESSDHTSLLKNLEHQSYKFLESSADRTSAQSFLPIDAMENRDNGSAVDNYIDKVPSGCNTSVNGSLSSLVTSDILNKMNSSLTNLSKIHVRQEPGHGPYNYASDSKGAKILASNKEAKGASNILNKDEDKYFRAPCNIGSKYVDIELSEETLVVEIVMANHEFYSSNVREFALWGSLIYPTDEWVSLGKFEAENNRASQIFRLKEPQWVRYLKLQMLSHYGSDFYCTMSMVEVHGIDAIEWILEDWIAEDTGGLGYQLSSFKSEDCSHVEKARMSISLSKSQVLSEETNNEEKIDTMLNQSLDAPARELAVISDGKMRNADISEPVHHQIGRPGLDSVMKLLMQKVRTLEQKQPSLSHSLEELDVRQRNIFGVQNYELKMIISKMENVTSEVANLSLLLQYMEEEQEREIQRLEECVLDWINAWNADLEFLRHAMKRSEDKELVALMVSLLTVVFVTGIQGFILLISFIRPSVQKQTMQFPCTTVLRSFPLLSCALVVCVLSL